MNILQQYKNFIQANHLFGLTDKLLLAVSGGVDSVVLCNLCHEAGYHFTIAHCNFNLRGEESQRDEAFVRGLGTKYGVDVLVNQFETKQYAAANKISIQEAARKLRYDWFYEIVSSEWSMVNEQQAIEKSEDKTTSHHSLLTTHHFILTAHHQDDNAETVIMNFFKGTGVNGLRGILPKQGKLVRPLLFLSKKQLLQYASEKDLQWVHDSSNDETKYTRNYFRHTVIPLIEKVYPEVTNNIADNIKRFTDIEILYQQAIETHKKKLIEHKGAEVHIPVLKLLQTIPLHTIVYEIIKDFRFTHHQIEEVIKLLYSESGKYITSPTHRILRNRKWLIITPITTQQSETIIIEKEDALVLYNDSKLIIKWLDDGNFSIPNHNRIAVLDRKEIQFPLILRKWKEGDYFYPLGMKKKKKLARFFIDLKLSKIDKEKVWVIESHKKILWVVGYRIDERFKVTPTTKAVLQLTTSSL